MRYFIGVDIGTKSAGVAMVDSDGNLVRSKQIDVSDSVVDGAQRIRYTMLGWLRALDDQAGDIVDSEYHAEDPPYVNNIHTYKVLQRMFGSVFQDSQVVEWTPTQIKACFAGNGRATKAQVKQTARIQFELQDVGYDEADAIAVAWTGYSKWREQEQVRRGLDG